MLNKRIRVLISGRVQGVFFRAFTRDAARGEGVAGWVRNLPDGRVEALFEGEASKVDRMVDWCHGGSPFSRVDRVESTEEEYTGEFQGFNIVH